jgi:hypothetical protein
MHDAHTETLIATKMRRLEELEKQHAFHGPLTPPHITMEIEDLRKTIADLRYQRSQIIFQTNHLDLQSPPQVQGLLLLVSPLRSGDALHTLSTYQAIDYHRGPLRRCWLIATNESQPTAEVLAKHFDSYHVVSTIHPVNNGADAADTQVVVETIYTQIEQDGELSLANIVADITGGTKAMTAGMVLACGTTRPMQYMLFKQGLPSLPVLLHPQSTENPT